MVSLLASFEVVLAIDIKDPTTEGATRTTHVQKYLGQICSGDSISDGSCCSWFVGWCHIRNSAFKMYPLRSVVVVVKWSACLPFILTIQFSNPAEAYSFSVKFVFEKNENKQKEAGVGPFL